MPTTLSSIVVFLVSALSLATARPTKETAVTSVFAGVPPITDEQFEALETASWHCGDGKNDISSLRQITAGLEEAQHCVCDRNLSFDGEARIAQLID